MNEQKTALYYLIHALELTSDEVANLTLGDLHLSGAKPLLHVWQAETGQRRSVPLDESTRNALVSWLLVRPDRPITLLFPGEDDEGLAAEAINGLLDGFTPDGLEDDDTVVITAKTIREEQLPNLGPLPSRQVPPPFTVTPPPPPPEHVGPKKADAGTEQPADNEPESKSERPKASPPPKPTAKPASKSKPVAAVPANRQRTIMLALGGLFLLACVGLVVAGAMILPAKIAGLFNEVDLPISVETAAPIAEADTATPTPQPATETPTPLPEPTETATPLPTDTPSPEPTATPLPPTDTPVPEATSTPVPTPTETPLPTATPVPVVAPVVEAPTPTPTAGFKYAAPGLISPESEFDFISGNTIDLQWEPVGELADNEQYAVRLVYFHNSEVVYRGTNMKETLWTVPFELYHDADGPAYSHTWYVYVEEVQPDGTGVPISPESERRSFTWR